MNTRRLCIVGGGSTRMSAPFSSDAVIWSTMSVGQELPRVDACFELHDGVYTPDQLNNIGCTIYSKELIPEILHNRRFPIEDLVNTFGKRFNGTVVMMLAFAYLEGYRDIWLYGIDFSSDAEYSRRNMFYWIMGYIAGKGAKITIPEGGLLSDTCQTYSYENSGTEYIEKIRSDAIAETNGDMERMMVLRERLGYKNGTLDVLSQIERRH
jgi:hypothetical protein